MACVKVQHSTKLEVCQDFFFLPTLWRNSAAVTLSPKHICGSAPHRHKDSEHSLSSKLHVQ